MSEKARLKGCLGMNAKRNANVPLVLRPGLQTTLRRSCPACQFATWWRKGPRGVYDEKPVPPNQTHLGLNPGSAILNSLIWGRISFFTIFQFYVWKDQETKLLLLDEVKYENT